MRSRDLIQGELYAATPRHSPVKVRVVEVSDDLRTRQRVLVRFESGIKAGEEMAVSLRRIYARWDDRYVAPGPLERVSLELIDGGEDEELAIGKVVTWPDVTGDLEWEVVGIHRDEVSNAIKEATLSSELFDQPTTRTVPVREIKLKRSPPTHGRDDSRGNGPLKPGRHSEPEHQVGSTPGGPNLFAPVRPVRELDEVMDNVIFSERCIQSFGSRFSSGQPRDRVLISLREEVRMKGYLDHSESDVGFAVVRVQGRFEFPLEWRPTPTEVLTVEHVDSIRKQRRHRIKRPRSRAQESGRRAA